MKESTDGLISVKKSVVSSPVSDKSEIHSETKHSTVSLVPDNKTEPIKNEQEISKDQEFNTNKENNINKKDKSLSKEISTESYFTENYGPSVKIFNTVKM